MRNSVTFSRRTVLAIMPALTLAPPSPAQGHALEVEAPEAPVHARMKVRSRPEAERLVAVLRKSSGCLRVDVFADGIGTVSIWQQWASADACRAFWARAGKARPRAGLVRIDF